MEREYDVGLAIPAKFGEILRSYLPVSRQETVGGFVLAAINYTLAQGDEGEARLTPDLCSVKEKEQDGGLEIHMQFHAAGRDVLRVMSAGDPNRSSWIVESMHGYMDALYDSLPRAAKIAAFPAATPANLYTI